MLRKLEIIADLIGYKARTQTLLERSRIATGVNDFSLSCAECGRIASKVFFARRLLVKVDNVDAENPQKIFRSSRSIKFRLN